MNFCEWYPYYKKILSIFNYKIEQDQKAAFLLSDLLRRNYVDISLLKKQIKGKSVIVIGPGISLLNNIDLLKRNFVRIAADGVTKFLLEHDICPDIVVTDLDGDIEFLKKADQNGAIIIVHAHGDNYHLLKKYTNEFFIKMGTTQAIPIRNIHNFGGFTDGDRCVFLADELKAAEIVLLGMDFEGKIIKFRNNFNINYNQKRKKLIVAKNLLEMLSLRTKSKLYNTSDTKIKGYLPYAS